MSTWVTKLRSAFGGGDGGSDSVGSDDRQALVRGKSNGGASGGGNGGEGGAASSSSGPNGSAVKGGGPQSGSLEQPTLMESLQQHRHAIGIAVLLVMCVGVVAGTIAADAVLLRSLTDRRASGDVVVQAGRGLVGFADELSRRVNSGGNSYTSADLTTAIVALAAYANAPASIAPFLLSNLTAARATSTSSGLMSYNSLVVAYQQLLTNTVRAMYAALYDAMEPSSRGLLGLLCTSSHVQRVAMPVVLAGPFALSSWSATDYINFLGSAADWEPCAALLPQTTFAAIMKDFEVITPVLPAAPSPAAFSQVGAGVNRNASDLVNRAAQWATAFSAAASEAQKDVTHQRDRVIQSLAFACCAELMFLVLLALVRFVSVTHSSARSDFRSVFRQLEATVKLISKYANALMTCSVRDGEWGPGVVTTASAAPVNPLAGRPGSGKKKSAADAAAGGATGSGPSISGSGTGIAVHSPAATGTASHAGSAPSVSGGFLHRIVEFVVAVRPYIAQSCFGDIENVPITGSSASRSGGIVMGGSGGGAGATAVRVDAAQAAAQAIRELRLRDLRPDMGMQVVSGTVMCISLAPFHGEAEAVYDAAVLDNTTKRMSYFLKAVEASVNGSTGVVQSVAGDYVLALWNVTSSTGSASVSAVLCGLQLMKSFATMPEFSSSLSMGVAQSFLLAGNVEVGRRKQLAVTGPAVSLAERLEGCNAAHKTSIMVDQACAEALSNTVITDMDITIRPVALLKMRDDADEYLTGYAVYGHRMRQEKLKAWNTLFKDLSVKLKAGALADALLEVEEYKTKHATDTATTAVAANNTSANNRQKAPPRSNADRSAECWKRTLTSMMRVNDGSSLKGATEFGV